MVLSYVDITYYSNRYQGDNNASTAVPNFNNYAIRATKEIRLRTFGNIDESSELPDEVKLCCCELIDKFISVDKPRSENGLILKTYSNDGDSGTFETEHLSSERIKEDIDAIVRSWLLPTGLMFCGRRRRS